MCSQKSRSPAPSFEFEDGRITVCVRARPLSERERQMGCGSCLRFQNGTDVCIFGAGVPSDWESVSSERQLLLQTSGHTFAFDHAYDPEVTQERVYEDVGKPVLAASFDGFNTCIFAYGQTGSGKSYCMMGPDGGLMIDREPGLVPRLCFDLFAEINRRVRQSVEDINNAIRTTVVRHQLPPELEISATASYFEIYHEKVHCLLRPNGDQLKVRQHPVLGVYVEGLTAVTVATLDEIITLMRMGNGRRHTASTNMNDRSSRSHAIFTITLLQKRKSTTSDGMASMTEMRAVINLVDLAGSERAKSTGAVGETLKEGAQINKSLATLGLVISALAEAGKSGCKNRHIPYRNSTLTYLLKESLGGNSKTFMLSTLSPATAHSDETMSTLRYADRAKSIVTRAFVNETAGDKRIRELENEVISLREKIRLMQSHVYRAPGQIGTTHVQDEPDLSGTVVPHAHGVSSPGDIDLTPSLSLTSSTSSLMLDSDPMSDSFQSAVASPGNEDVGTLESNLRLVEEEIQHLIGSGEGAVNVLPAASVLAAYKTEAAAAMEQCAPYLHYRLGTGPWTTLARLVAQTTYLDPQGLPVKPGPFPASSQEEGVDEDVVLTTSSVSLDLSSCSSSLLGSTFDPHERHVRIPTDGQSFPERDGCSLHRRRSGTIEIQPYCGCSLFLNDAETSLRDSAVLKSGDVFTLGHMKQLQFQLMYPSLPVRVSRIPLAKEISTGAAASPGTECSRVSESIDLEIARCVDAMTPPQPTSPKDGMANVPSRNVDDSDDGNDKRHRADGLPSEVKAGGEDDRADVSPLPHECTPDKPCIRKETNSVDATRRLAFTEERRFVGLYNLVLLGPSGAGKTYLQRNLQLPDTWFSFLTRRNAPPNPTWGIRKSVISVHDHEGMKLSVLELGGSDCFAFLHDQLPTRRGTYMLCFALTMSPSLELFRNVLESVLCHTAHRDVSLVLVGTHLDQCHLSDSQIYQVLTILEQEIQSFLEMMQPRAELRPTIVARVAVDNENRHVFFPTFRGMKTFPDLLSWLSDHATQKCKNDLDFPYGLIPLRCIALGRKLRSLASLGQWCLAQSEYEHLAVSVDQRYAIAPSDLPVHTQLLRHWGILQHRGHRDTTSQAVLLDVDWVSRLLSLLACCGAYRVDGLCWKLHTGHGKTVASKVLSLGAHPEVLELWGEDQPKSVAKAISADTYSLLPHGVLTTKAAGVLFADVLGEKKVSLLRLMQVLDVLHVYDWIVLGTKLRYSPSQKESADGVSQTHEAPTAERIRFESFVLMPSVFRAPLSAAAVACFITFLEGPFCRFTFNMLPQYFFAKLVCRVSRHAEGVYFGPVHRKVVDEDGLLFPVADDAECFSRPPFTVIVSECAFWQDAVWVIGPRGSRVFIRLVHHSLFVTFHGTEEHRFHGVIRGLVVDVAHEYPGAQCVEHLLCMRNRSDDIVPFDVGSDSSKTYYYPVDNCIDTVVNICTRKQSSSFTQTCDRVPLRESSVLSRDNEIIPFLRDGSLRVELEAVMHMLSTYGVTSESVLKDVMITVNKFNHSVEAAEEGGADLCGEAIDALVDALAHVQ